MKHSILIAAAAAALTGCGDGPKDGVSRRGAQGRYLGIGVYAADRLWQEVAGGQAASDPKVAALADDSQIIVVVDSATGEVRQCGNLSGRCIATNPWRGAAAPLPAAIGRHAADLDREAAAADGEAIPAKPRP